MSEEEKILPPKSRMSRFVDGFIMAFAGSLAFGFFMMVWQEYKQVNEKLDRNTENNRQVFISIASSQEQLTKNFAEMGVEIRRLRDCLDGFEIRLEELEKKANIKPNKGSPNENYKSYDDLEKELQKKIRDDIRKREKELRHRMDNMQQMQAPRS